MRFATIAGRSAISYGDGFTDLHDASRGRFPADPLAALERWTDVREWYGAGVLEGRPTTITDPEFQAPVPRPPQVFAVGLNYAAHADEVAMRAGALSVFTKFPTSVTAPDGLLILPSATVDWEVELVAVLGRELYAADAATAAKAVAGFAVGQDYSDRELQMAADPPQFSLAKSHPGFGPVGPWLTTPDELDDIEALPISCTINGETVQDSTTAAMIRSPYQVVAEISQVCRLLPGDLVFTGTPSGVGMGRTPPRYLVPGDEVRSSIGGLGSLVQRCVSGGSGVHR